MQDPRAPSGSLVRSKSGHSILSNKRQNVAIKRSNSASRPQKLDSLHCSNPAISERKGSKKITTAQSAWALSPGRGNTSVSISPSSQRENGGVLKYFKRKKACPIEEEGRHQYRILYSSLSQWLFVNARARICGECRKERAEERMLNGWLKIMILRRRVLEKRLRVMTWRGEVKLGRILVNQMGLLGEWEEMEGLNSEGVGEIVRKVTAVCSRVFVEGFCKRELEGVVGAMKAADVAMKRTELPMSIIFSKVENTLYLVTELVSTWELLKEMLEETVRLLIHVAQLLERERFAMVRLMQAVKAARSS